MASELIFLVKICRIVAGRRTTNFKAKFPVVQEQFAKTTGGRVKTAPVAVIQVNPHFGRNGRNMTSL